MIRLLTLVLLAFCLNAAMAQKPAARKSGKPKPKTTTVQKKVWVEKTLNVGQKVHINACKPGAESFESMDVYAKTRYPDHGIEKDSVTGDGVFEWFFSGGDFDAKRLPCSFGNRNYTIAALRELPEKEDETKLKKVVLLYGTKPLEMIWIELEKAVDLKEIDF